MKKTCSILWLSCLSFLVAISIGVFGVGCEGSSGSNSAPIITRAEYNQIRDGMSYAQVVAIVGSEPTSANNGNVVVATWSNPGESGADVGFANGVCTGKAYWGNLP